MLKVTKSVGPEVIGVGGVADLGMARQEHLVVVVALVLPLVRFCIQIDGFLALQVGGPDLHAEIAVELQDLRAVRLRAHVDVVGENLGFVAIDAGGQEDAGGVRIVNGNKRTRLAVTAAIPSPARSAAQSQPVRRFLPTCRAFQRKGAGTRARAGPLGRLSGYDILLEGQL